MSVGDAPANLAEAEREEFKAALAGADAVTRYYHFEEIPSTSDWARDLVRRSSGSAKLHGTLVISENQTRGRGRLNRRWESVTGKSLLFTLIRYNADGIGSAMDERSERLKNALVPGLALCGALRQISLEARLKYPNDVLVNNHKVAGVLVEQMSCNNSTFTLVGIGINVNQVQEDLPAETRWPATSLRIVTGSVLNRPRLLQEILQSLQSCYNLTVDDLLRWVNRDCCLLGKWVRVDTTHGIFEGIAERIDEGGGLVVRNPALPIQHVHMGEVLNVWMKSDRSSP